MINLEKAFELVKKDIASNSNLEIIDKGYYESETAYGIAVRDITCDDFSQPPLKIVNKSSEKITELEILFTYKEDLKFKWNK